MGIINDISEDNLNSNFFVKIVEEWENKKKSFDFALIKYFKECAHFTNIHFLKTIYIILNLFREGINNYFNEIKKGKRLFHI